MAKDAITVTGIEQYQEVLRKMQTDNPATKKALQSIIRHAISDARKNIVKDAQDVLENDPRHAYKAVRSSVYKQILGAQVNILDMRKKAGTPTSYEPPRKLQPGQRGGNRVPRGARTDSVMHYGPHDRQWILRFINSGTKDRTAGTRGGRLSGNRGSIAPRNFFRGAGERALTRAADNLATLIDNELEAMLDKKSTA